ncbi:AAA domain-containing protein [Trichoderma breve]|uniref:AAA domain-containing protein n=1 Tax=Trichoderma breve TaxID=2034170 RepID=A0A9W9B5F3_9HYPO|nr:AAA domain-containing protein [Trichoderma breve]KAJ4856217.1 AAA domain-containing protein [Trichoderma breve]
MFSTKSYMDDRFDVERYKSKKGKDKAQDCEDREERIQQFLRSYEWGRILIVTGYREQKRLLLKTLAELPEAEVPPGLVSVRTIDDSPSHQAEAVICDMVRTDKPGFMMEDQRLAVMTTRAQAFIINVGRTDVIKGKDARTLRTIYDYLKDRDAIVKVFGWNEFCSIKADRKDQQETATQDAHKAYMKAITTAYHDYIDEKKKPEVKDESIAGPSAQRVEKGKGPQQEAPIVKGPTPVAGPSTQRVEKNGGPQQKAPVAKGPAVKQSRAKAPSSSTVGLSK